MQDIIDIKETIPLEAPTPWALWISIGVASIIIITLVALLLRKLNKPKAVIPPTPYQIARKELDKLSLTLETSDDEEYAEELSDLLRQFIEAHYKIPSSKSTTQEFFQLLSKKNPFSEEVSLELQKFLELCDQVKFARHSLSTTVKADLLKTANRICKA